MVYGGKGRSVSMPLVTCGEVWEERRCSVILWLGLSLLKSLCPCNVNLTSASKFFPLLTVMGWLHRAAAEAAKSLQLCPTLCDPIDGSSPGSPVPGILQEWVAISFSNAWKWKVKVKSESEKWKWSRSVVSNPQRPHGLQPTRLLRPWDFPGRSTGVGCHCLLRHRARVEYLPAPRYTALWWNSTRLDSGKIVYPGGSLC